MSHNHLHYDFFGVKWAAIFPSSPSQAEASKAQEALQLAKMKVKEVPKDRTKKPLAFIHSPPKKVHSKLSFSCFFVGHWFECFPVFTSVKSGGIPAGDCTTLLGQGPPGGFEQW